LALAGAAAASAAMAVSTAMVRRMVLPLLVSDSVITVQEIEVAW